MNTKNFLKVIALFLFMQVQVSEGMMQQESVYPKKGTVNKPFTYVFAQPRGNSLIVGRLRSGMKITVIAATTDAQFVQTEVVRNSGGKEFILKGYVRLEDILLEEVVVPAQPLEVAQQPEEKNKLHLDYPYLKRPWGLGFGFGGYASRNESQIGLLAELRYRWTHVTESIFGLDLTFGSGVHVVSRVAQRFYLSLDDTIQPYLHLGYRSFGALDLGIGVSVSYTERSYFEVGANQLISTRVNGESLWVFGGSSGFRF